MSKKRELLRIQAFVACIVKGPLPVEEGSQDLALCMFVLSAIAPDRQTEAFRNLAKVLRIGGKLLVRDYGKY